MRYRDIRTVAEALALIEATGRSNAGIILDVLHLHRAETDVAAVAALPPCRVAYAQLCDVAPGPAPTLDALPDGTPLAVETPVAAEAALPTQQRLRKVAPSARFLGPLSWHDARRHAGDFARPRRMGWGWSIKSMIAPSGRVGRTVGRTASG